MKYEKKFDLENEIRKARVRADYLEHELYVDQANNRDIDARDIEARAEVLLQQWMDNHAGQKRNRDEFIAEAIRQYEERNNQGYDIAVDGQDNDSDDEEDY